MRKKPARYLDVLIQLLDELHMLVEHRLQTKDFIAE